MTHFNNCESLSNVRLRPTLFIVLIGIFINLWFLACAQYTQAYKGSKLPREQIATLKFVDKKIHIVKINGIAYSTDGIELLPDTTYDIHVIYDGYYGSSLVQINTAVRSSSFSFLATDKINKQNPKWPACKLQIKLEAGKEYQLMPFFRIMQIAESNINDVGNDLRVYKICGY